MLGGGLLLLGPKAQFSRAAGSGTNLPGGATPPANETMKIVRLSDTMIIAQEDYFRVFALNTARGIVVIDTHFSLARMRAAKEMIEAEFKRQDYAFVINTHDHPEHMGGNALFKPMIIVGQEGMAEGQTQYQAKKSENVAAQIEQAIAKEAETLAKLDKATPAYGKSTEQIARLRDSLETWNAGLVFPAIMFRDRLTLDLGDRTVILISCGKGGHSGSDSLVYIPEEKALLLGGACSARELPPEIQAAGGTMDLARLISALSEFADSDLELKYIIPGHAPYLTKADLKFIRDYYRTLWQGFNQAKKDGLTLEQAKQRYSLGSGFGDFTALAKPTGKMIQRHDKNMDVLWAFLNQSTQERRAAP